MAKTRAARPSSQTDAHARRSSASGYTAYTTCGCGNSREWTFDSDAMTGSSYARCGVCHKVHQFVGAWRDNALGMNFGSWWSQKTGEGFVVEAGND